MRALALAACLLALAAAGCGADEPETAFPPEDPSAVPPGGLDPEAEVDIVLEERDGSGITGTARLTPENGTGTVVEVRLRGDGDELAVELRDGSCDEPDAPRVVTLDRTDAAVYEARAPRSLEDMLGGEFSVAALGEDGAAVACGDLEPVGAG